MMIHPESDPQTPEENRGLGSGRKLFGELLVEAGVISAEALQEALERQRASGERIGEVLVNAGLATEDEILGGLARQLGVEIFQASSVPAIDTSVVLTVPEYLARQHHLLAVRREDDFLTIAMANPLDLVAIDDVRVATGCEVSVQVGRRSDIDQAIATCYGSATAGRHLAEAIEGAKVELGVEAEQSLEGMDEQELRSKALDAPIVRLVNLILSQAIAEGATDIHVEPLRESVVVRYRIDGVLYDAITPPAEFQEALVVRVKILSNMDVAERRIPLDGRFTARFERREVDIRVSTIPTVYGEKVAMRLLDKSAFSTNAEGLGFEPENLSLFRKALKKPYGMVLISGPTGSGKTTTLYAGMSELDRTTKNITTLEDPVEYFLDRINQVSINTKAGMTFAKGLRAFLRQDPDIIMVGEIRDLETAELAVRSALTGHLVLSTVHANDAAATMTRLVDIGIEPYLVTSAVHLVMAQRLVRRVCQACKAPYEPDPIAVRALDPSLLDGTTFYRGTGCKQCRGRTYRGRTAVYEVLPVTPEIADLVLARKSANEIRRKAVEQGLMTLKESAALKVRAGLTTVEEALSVCAEVI